MDFFKLIFEFAKSKGIVATFHVLAFGVAAAYLIANIKNGKISNIYKRFFKSRKTIFEQDGLLTHEMFKRLRVLINTEIQHFTLAEKLREAIFKDFLLFKFTAIQKGFTNFLLKGDLEELSESSFQDKILECIEEIIKTYETKAILEGIDPIVVQKFNEWHKDRVVSVYTWINTVCEEEMYKTNTERTRVIFDFMVHINNTTIIEAKKTLINLNGQLNNVVYKGITYKGNNSKQCQVL